MVARRFYFEGRVQGVGFRATTKHVARGYEVVGWVKNLSDGQVEVLAAAESASEIEAFLQGILDCGLKSHIRDYRVEAADAPPGTTGFEIAR